MRSYESQGTCRLQEGVEGGGEDDRGGRGYGGEVFVLLDARGVCEGAGGIEGGGSGEAYGED